MMQVSEVGQQVIVRKRPFVVVDIQAQGTPTEPRTISGRSPPGTARKKEIHLEEKTHADAESRQKPFTPTFFSDQDGDE